LSAITITDIGRNLFRDSLDAAQNIKITYVALGTSSAAPSTSDTSLVAEVFRKRVTSYTNGSTGVINISLYLGPNDAVGKDIEEVGFWGGNATATPYSGVMLARGLFSHNPKTNLESITFTLNFVVS
jgi:hypothetical protein